jgi:hypothetical protein
MYFQGRIVYLMNDEKPLVVTDVEWLMNLLHCIRVQPKEKSGDSHLSCLNENTSLWRDKYLLKMASKHMKDEHLV